MPPGLIDLASHVLRFVADFAPFARGHNNSRLTHLASYVLHLVVDLMPFWPTDHCASMNGRQADLNRRHSGPTEITSHVLRCVADSRRSLGLTITPA